MHESLVLTLLFPALITGMLITMLMSFVFIESKRNTGRGDRRVEIPSEVALQSQSLSKVVTERAA